MAGWTALSQLAALDHVQVVQQELPTMCGNKFAVRSADGVELLAAKEEGYSSSEYKLSYDRPFVMPIYDSHGLEMMRFRRPPRWGGSRVEVLVQDAVVCVVREKMVFWGVVMYIDDEAEQPRYRIKGVPVGDTVDFKLQTADKSDIGVVRREKRIKASSRMDTYTLNFPIDMELRFKAGVIAASILIDYMKYQKR